jgi:hypothetical protein
MARSYLEVQSLYRIDLDGTRHTVRHWAGGVYAQRGQILKDVFGNLLRNPGNTETGR